MRIAVGVLVILTAMAVQARADDDDAPKGEKGRPVEKGTFGVGVIIGEPTGLTAKLYLHDDRALQFEVGGAFAAGGYQGTGDYLFHPWIAQDRDSFVMPIYIGPGIRLIDYTGGSNGSDHFAVGARGVVGMLFDFKSVPLDAFIELAGILQYDFGGTVATGATGNGSKGFGAGLNGGAGMRYYF